MSKEELETLFERHHEGYGYYNKNEIIKELLILLNQKKQYIGLIHEERNDGFTIGYSISANIKRMLKWKEEMLECGNIEDCKIFEIKEVIKDER